MTPGPISEVPGFHRPDPQEEPPRLAPQGPIIDAVPGVARAATTVARIDAPDVAVPLSAVPLSAVPLPAVPLTAAPPGDTSMLAAFTTRPAKMPPLAPPTAPSPPSPPRPPPVPSVTNGTGAALPFEIDLWGDAPEASDAEDLDATRAVRMPSSLVLRWDDGTVLEASSPTVVGRDPVATGADVAVALDDPSRSLSKTHARFTPGLAPTVEDLHSTNGVRIDRDGAAIPVVPGQPATLRHGDDVYCGTRRTSVEVRT